VKIEEEGETQPPVFRHYGAVPLPHARIMAHPAFRTDAAGTTLQQRLSQMSEDQRSTYLLYKQTEAAQKRLRAEPQQQQQPNPKPQAELIEHVEARNMTATESDLEKFLQLHNQRHNQLDHAIEAKWLHDNRPLFERTIDVGNRVLLEKAGAAAPERTLFDRSIALEMAVAAETCKRESAKNQVDESRQVGTNMAQGRQTNFYTALQNGIRPRVPRATDQQVQQTAEEVATKRRQQAPKRQRQTSNKSEPQVGNQPKRDSAEDLDDKSGNEVDGIFQKADVPLDYFAERKKRLKISKEQTQPSSESTDLKGHGDH